MHHTVYLRSERIKELLDYRGIGTCRREYKLSRIERRALDSIGKPEAAAIYKFLRNRLVIALRILLSQIFGKYIVTGTGKPVAAHSSVVLLLVSGLTT